MEPLGVCGARADVMASDASYYLALRFVAGCNQLDLVLYDYANRDSLAIALRLPGWEEVESPCKTLAPGYSSGRLVDGKVAVYDKSDLRGSSDFYLLDAFEGSYARFDCAGCRPLRYLGRDDEGNDVFLMGGSRDGHGRETVAYFDPRSGARKDLVRLPPDVRMECVFLQSPVGGMKFVFVAACPPIDEGTGAAIDPNTPELRCAVYDADRKQFSFSAPCHGNQVMGLVKLDDGRLLISTREDESKASAIEVYKIDTRSGQIDRDEAAGVFLSRDRERFLELNEVRGTKWVVVCSSATRARPAEIGLYEPGAGRSLAGLDLTEDQAPFWPQWTPIPDSMLRAGVTRYFPGQSGDILHVTAHYTGTAKGGQVQVATRRLEFDGSGGLVSSTAWSVHCTASTPIGRESYAGLAILRGNNGQCGVLLNGGLVAEVRE